MEKQFFEHKKIKVILEKQKKDKCVLARTVNANGVMLASGSAEKQSWEKAFNSARQKITVIIDDFLEDVKSDIDLESNRHYSGIINLRMPKDVHENSAFIAEINDISLNDFLVNAAKQSVDMFYNHNTSGAVIAEEPFFPEECNAPVSIKVPYEPRAEQSKYRDLQATPVKVG